MSTRLCLRLHGGQKVDRLRQHSGYQADMLLLLCELIRGQAEQIHRACAANLAPHLAQPYAAA